MPVISKQKKEKIAEQILLYLFSTFPNQKFTSDIAKELARDEEFIKTLLEDLSQKEFVTKVDKNPQGIKYSRRIRWRISNKSYQAYKELQ